jgi:hypothetical protein
VTGNFLRKKINKNKLSDSPSHFFSSKRYFSLLQTICDIVCNNEKVISIKKCFQTIQSESIFILSKTKYILE